MSDRHAGDVCDLLIKSILLEKLFIKFCHCVDFANCPGLQ